MLLNLPTLAMCLKQLKLHLLNKKLSTNIELRDTIGNIIEVHEVKVNHKMKNDHRTKEIHGLLHLHRAMKNFINPDIIRESFIEKGVVFPL